mgnify:CR=1 FL=1
MILIGILIGLFIFSLYMALYAVLNKVYKINPLLHLGGFYIMVEVLVLKLSPKAIKPNKSRHLFNLMAPSDLFFV